MIDNKTYIIELKGLLTRFFDKRSKLSEETILKAAKFLFEGIEFPEILNHADLNNTLIYLKNVMERNKFSTLNELIEYYDKKHKKMNSLFDKLEEVYSEECFALSFNDACSMYLAPVEQEHKFKSDNLYYLEDMNGFCASDTKTLQQLCEMELNVQSSWLQQKDYISQIKSGCLQPQEAKYNNAKDNTDAVVSN